MLAIEPRRLRHRDEELRPVAVGARVGHREQPRARVLDAKVLVVKLPTVDRFAARPVAVGEVAALQHEARNDAVEVGAGEAERHARLALALFASAQRSEVLGRPGALVAVQAKDDPSGGLVVEGDVEERARRHRGVRRLVLRLEEERPLHLFALEQRQHDAAALSVDLVNLPVAFVGHDPAPELLRRNHRLGTSDTERQNVLLQLIRDLLGLDVVRDREDHAVAVELVLAVEGLPTAESKHSRARWPAHGAGNAAAV